MVAIAGNHDSPGLFEALAPFVADRNVHLVGEIKAPEVGGVLDLETPRGRAVVSCFPFLREGRAFNVWEPAEEHYKKYADRLRHIAQAYSTHASEIAGTDAVTFLVSHFWSVARKCTDTVPHGVSGSCTWVRPTPPHPRPSHPDLNTWRSDTSMLRRKCLGPRCPLSTPVRCSSSTSARQARRSELLSLT